MRAAARSAALIGQQEVISAELRPDHRLSRGLTHGWIFGQQFPGSFVPYDAVTRQRATSSRSTWAWVATANGMIARGTTGGAGGSQITLGLIDSLVPLAPPVTVMMIYRKNDSTNRNTTHFGANQDSPSSAVRCDLTAPFSDGNVYWDFGGTSAGTSRLSFVAGSLIQSRSVLVATAGSGDKSAVGMSLWHNGVKKASHTGVVPSRAASSQPLVVNGADLTSGADLAEYEAIYVWNRALSDDEIIELSSSPYSMWSLVGPARAFAVSVVQWAAVGTLSLNGAANLTLFQNFAAAGVLALAGTPGLTTVIQMIGSGDLRLDGGGAALRVARNVSRLKQCGDPLSTACQDWMP